MKVIPIRPRGFCPGVVKANNIVEDVISNEAYPRPITILGMIVHNQFVVNRFTEKGVITLDDPQLSRMELAKQIHSGTVIITAHGVGSEVINDLRNRHIVVVDATCKDVLKTQKLVAKKIDEGYSVIYIGKKNHPETEAILSISSRIILIENEEDVQKIELSDNMPFITNQTTFSIRDIEKIRNKVLQRFPNAIFSDEICDSTRIRQEAILNSNKGVDVCFIVGDKRSNNTRNLVKISTEETHTLTYLIESVHDITMEMLKDKKVASVSSGASTPNHVTDAVIQFLENY